MTEVARPEDERTCQCVDPENCTERIPGYRCKKDFMPKLPELVVTKGGVPFADQAEGIRQFKEACLASKAPTRPRASRFPGTAGMYASQRRLAVTQEWMKGWNACLDEIDRLGGFNEE